MHRLITRHTNRKLYDPQAKRYVSLADIASLIVAGESVRVVEHPTGEDATTRILAQALVDLVKRRASSLPHGLMETLVRLAGGAKTLPAVAALDAHVKAPIKDLADRARAEAETIATRLVARGRLGIEEALHLRKEVEGAIHSSLQAATETAARAPRNALRPGRSVQTIAGLARELKQLEAMVSPQSPENSATLKQSRSRRTSSASSVSQKKRRS